MYLFGEIKNSRRVFAARKLDADRIEGVVDVPYALSGCLKTVNIEK